MASKIRIKDSTNDVLYPVTTVDLVEVVAESMSLEALVQAAYDAAVNAVFPIGAVYFSALATNPSTIFPGTTWEAYGQGRMLRNAGTITDVESNEQTFVIGGTGGEYRHTISVDEMISHRHRLWSQRYYEGTSQRDYGASDNGGGRTLSFTGGGIPRSNVQPSITCYMWRRLT